MESLKTSAGLNRIGSLDSLRGLASLAVLLGHTLAVFSWDIEFSKLFFINNMFDGRSAVTMFFVLSGFVLSLGYADQTNRRPMYLVPFFAKRFTRIWLPWFAFFVLSWLSKEFLFYVPQNTEPVLTAHHTHFWSIDCNFLELLKQMIFRLHDSSKLLIPQDWSLGVEMKSAILIPIFLILVRKSSIALFLFGLLLFVVMPTGYYYFSFAIGVCAALAYNKCKIRSNKGLLLFVIGLLLYQIRWANSYLAFLDEGLIEKYVWLISSIGCSFILYGVLTNLKLQNIMERPCLSYLGRVSYSLYLVQVIVLLCLAPWIVVFLGNLGVESHGWLQLLLLLIVSSVCLVLANLGEKYIEEPCVKLGRIVTKKLHCYKSVEKFKI